MADIAREAGVSRNAVSLALRNDPQIAHATRERIQAIADRLGYQRNPAVGTLMSQMRRRSSQGSLGTLALINANHDRNAIQDHPTIPDYFNGCRSRALSLGYSVDTFWLNEPGMSGNRWKDILLTRGIRGILLIGMMKQNRIPECLVPSIEALPCVVTGVRTRRPAMSFACVDHHILTLRAFEKAIDLGYRRPGLVLDQEIDDLVEHRFSAGYASGQLLLPPQDRIPPLFDVHASRVDPGIFRRWFETHRPDVIFTLYNVVRTWIQDLGLRVPQDIGLIQLEWRGNRPEWAGMRQHNDLCGSVAVDMLLRMIHNGECGIPPFPIATLIGPTWVDGSTVRYPG